MYAIHVFCAVRHLDHACMHASVIGIIVFGDLESLACEAFQSDMEHAHVQSLSHVSKTCLQCVHDLKLILQ
jgi:hypothetical protein